MDVLTTIFDKYLWFKMTDQVVLRSLTYSMIHSLACIQISQMGQIVLETLETLIHINLDSMSEDEFLGKHALMKQTAVKSIFGQFLSDHSIDSNLASLCYRILQEVSPAPTEDAYWGGKESLTVDCCKSFLQSVNTDDRSSLDLRGRLRPHQIHAVHPSSSDGTDSRTVMRSLRTESDVHPSNFVQSLLGHTEVFPQTTLCQLWNDRLLHATEDTSSHLATSITHSSPCFWFMFWNECDHERSDHLWNISVRTIDVHFRHLLSLSLRFIGAIRSRNQRNMTIHSTFAITFRISLIAWHK